MFWFFLLTIDFWYMSVNSKFLVDVLNQNMDADQEANENFDFLGSSPYFDDDTFIKSIDHNWLTILSTNIQSIRSKYDSIVLQLDIYNKERKIIDVICLRETWCIENTGYSHIDIPGYVCTSKYASCGEKGGLATYVSEDLYFNVIDTPSYSSSIWENIFVSVNRSEGGEPLVIGNIYRPPRDRADLLTTFRDELKLTIDNLDLCEQLYLAGDYNLDLLRVDASPGINSFFELLCSSSIFPKIFLPTRITPYTMTLIDNFFCKHSKYFSHLQAGILSNRLSDHQPYFISICFPGSAAAVWPAVDPAHKRPLNKSKINKFRSILTEQLPLIDFDRNESATPDENCQKLVDFLSGAYDSSRIFEKPCSKRKKPRTPWITKGLLRSINTRDKLCSKILKCNNSKRREALELQLKQFKKVLRRTCNLAKKKYYENLFEKAKNDSRKVWSIVNSLMNNSSGNCSKLPDSFHINGEMINDPKTIANKLNEFFIQIAEKITTNLGESEYNFDHFMSKANINCMLII